MGENKRKARRISVDWTLELTNKAGASLRSRIVNVSRTGILFMSPHPFHANEMLRMVIVVRSTCQITCVARVVRQLPGTSRFATYAAEFVGFTEDGQSLFLETLAEVLKRAPDEKVVIPEAKPPPRAAAPPPPSNPDSPIRRNPGPIVIRR